MAYTNQEALNECFNILWPILSDKQHSRQEDISFQSGIIQEEEGYKYAIIEKGGKIRKEYPLNDSKLIGTGKIGEMALRLLEICPKEDGKVQNLVDYRDVTLFKKYLHSEHAEDIEKALYLLFEKEAYEEAFNLLVCTFGKKYALISYFFFLKDSGKYQVVRPKNMAKKLSLITIQKQCALECTWENYQVYLAILREVREFLEGCLVEKITLTDAHSFVWMFWMLEEQNNTPTPQGAQMQENETMVICSGEEGRKILYYTTRYERNPKLRLEAIRLHGCVCAVCEFDFGKKYGDLGKDFIEVHHTKPLHTLEEEKIVSAADDLVCLCANCHRMIHRKRNAVLTVEQLKEIVKKEATCSSS